MNHIDAVERMARDYNHAVLTRRVKKGELLDLFGLIVRHLDAHRKKADYVAPKGANDADTSMHRRGWDDCLAAQEAPSPAVNIPWKA